MKTIRWKGLVGFVVMVVLGFCSVGCEGLSVSLGSDGKFVVSGTVPAPKGKVVILDEKGGK